MEFVSPRVNAARLSNYVGKTVRLTCKLLKFQGEDMASVQACDGGQVTITFPDVKKSPFKDTYAEILGKVLDASTIKLMAVIDLGSDLDLGLVNDTVELMHDPRFFNKMFSSST